MRSSSRSISTDTDPVHDRSARVLKIAAEGVHEKFGNFARRHLANLRQEAQHPGGKGITTERRTHRLRRAEDVSLEKPASFNAVLGEKYGLCPFR